jgi:ribosome-associated heat shock protein Hsp15
VSDRPTLRIDKLLWCLRLARTRTLAQRLVGEGHVRRNGARVGRSHEPVAVGDILTLPLGARVKVIEVLALPPRRGPADEAQACYRVLDDGNGLAVAAAPPSVASGEPQP